MAYNPVLDPPRGDFDWCRAQRELSRGTRIYRASWPEGVYVGLVGDEVRYLWEQQPTVDTTSFREDRRLNRIDPLFTPTASDVLATNWLVHPDDRV